MWENHTLELWGALGSWRSYRDDGSAGSVKPGSVGQTLKKG